MSFTTVAKCLFWKGCSSDSPFAHELQRFTGCFLLGFALLNIVRLLVLLSTLSTEAASHDKKPCSRQYTKALDSNAMSYCTNVPSSKSRQTVPAFLPLISHMLGIWCGDPVLEGLYLSVDGHKQRPPSPNPIADHFYFQHIAKSLTPAPP